MKKLDKIKYKMGKVMIEAFLEELGITPDMTLKDVFVKLGQIKVSEVIELMEEAVGESEFEA